MAKREVAQAFIRGEYEQSGAFVSMGSDLFSYAMKLASRKADGGIIFTPEMQAYLNGEPAPSRTTASHMSALKRAAYDALNAGAVASVGTM